MCGVLHYYAYNPTYNPSRPCPLGAHAQRRFLCACVSVTTLAETPLAKTKLRAGML